MFLKKISSPFLEKFLSTKLWKSIVRINLRLYGYPKLPLESYFEIRRIVKENLDDIFCFVGVDNASVATWFQRKVLGYYWGHTGFVEVDDEGELSINHIRYYGLLRWKLLKYLRECDEFVLLKLPLNSEEKEIVRKRLAKVNKSRVRYKLRDNLNKLPQYKDPKYWYHSDRFEFYCSEYQYFICQGLMNDVWDRGKDRFTPDDVFNGCEVVWEYRTK